MTEDAVKFRILKKKKKKNIVRAHAHTQSHHSRGGLHHVDAVLPEQFESLEAHTKSA